MFQLVVIGTSRGGLNALRCLLSGLPEDFPLPIVIAQHRTKDSGQGLATLMASTSSLPIIEPHDKQEIAPGIVYLAPADYHLMLESEYFTLSTESPLHFSRPSIDVLFESAAEAYRSSLIGVILTGANADGAEGTASIKRHGGFVIVQDPADAEARAMPEAAIAAGADRVLPLPEIAPVLARLARSNSSLNPG